MIFHRHKWKEKKTEKGVSIKRECLTCGKKEINFWGDYRKVKTKRDEELYAEL